MNDRLFSLLLALAVFAVTVLTVSCTSDISEEDLAEASTPKVRTYFNFTGTRFSNSTDAEVDDMLVQHIDRANSHIDFSVMGFTRSEVIDALERAHHRGIRLRFVGDGRHLESGNRGYEVMDELNIPMIVGNQWHIMHNKFFVIDDRFTITGTGNITPTGYDKNANNYVFIDSPAVGADFTDEFNQMFAGRFGNAKRPIDNGNRYEVGDTTVEVYFSPQEDAMGRILEGIENAEESVHFMIFAFTKDQVGSAFIAKHLEFTRYNRCCDPTRAADRSDPEIAAECEALVVCRQPFRHKEVRGVIDKSQLHSNGPYHEVYRMLLFGIPMRLDGNDHSYLPGDYQAGGGRMHSKTMVLDADLPTGRVLTGSFNWSSSATIANDETFLVLEGERVSRETKDFWDRHWADGKSFGVDYAGPEGTIERGDVIFNEIHWDGFNGLEDASDFGGDDVFNDEFIELLNTTGRPIDLSMWTIGTPDDFVLGFYPGTVIGPYERFLVVDHNIEPFTDFAPQDAPSAFSNADFVMNTANDQRFLRLNLRNANLSLRLVDPRGNVIDRAGDGGPAYFGGRRFMRQADLGEIPAEDAEMCADYFQWEDDDRRERRLVNFSMERVHFETEPHVLPGNTAEAWALTDRTTGGENVNACFLYNIVATPGEVNSVNRDKNVFGTENEAFRR